MRLVRLTAIVGLLFSMFMTTMSPLAAQEAEVGDSTPVVEPSVEPTIPAEETPDPGESTATEPAAEITPDATATTESGDEVSASAVGDAIPVFISFNTGTLTPVNALLHLVVVDNATGNVIFDHQVTFFLGASIVNVGLGTEGSTLTVSIDGTAGNYSYRAYQTSVPAYDNHQIGNNASFNFSVGVARIANSALLGLDVDTQFEGGSVPAGAHLLVTNDSNGGATVFDGDIASTPTSVGTNVIANGDTLTFTVTAPGFDTATESVAASNNNGGSFLHTISIAAAMVSPTVTITTEDGGMIPAGSVIIITNTSNGNAELFNQTVAVPSGIPLPLGVGPVVDGSTILVTVSSASPYADFSQSFVATSSSLDFTATLLLQQVSPVVTITTEDGGMIPAGSVIIITNTSNGNAELFNQTVAVPSGIPLPLPLASVVTGSNLLVTITDAAGYQNLAESFTVALGSENITVTLLRTPPTTGNLLLTITTEDGGDIPTNAIISVGGTDIVVASAEVAAADAPSGTTFVFNGVALGTLPVTVTNAAPYEDFAGTVEVEAGEGSSAEIELLLVQIEPTVVPTETVAPEPTETAGATPVVTTTPAPETGGKPGTTVTALPNTGNGTQHDGMNYGMLILAASMLLVVAGGFAVSQRRSQRGR